jgi:hypothetical protein
MAGNGQYQCRICLEESNSDEAYISPCRCNGSAKYVHRQCLDNWRSQRPDEDNFIRCNECRFNYVIQVAPQDKKDKILRKRRYHIAVAHDTIKIILLILTILVVLAILIYIVDIRLHKIDKLMRPSLGFLRYLIAASLFIFVIIGLIGLVALLVVSGFSLSGWALFGGSNTILIVAAIIGGIACVYGSWEFISNNIKHRRRTIWLRQEAEIRIVKDFKGREYELPPIEGRPHPPGGQQVDVEDYGGHNGHHDLQHPPSPQFGDFPPWNPDNIMDVDNEGQDDNNDVIIDIQPVHNDRPEGWGEDEGIMV